MHVLKLQIIVLDAEVIVLTPLFVNVLMDFGNKEPSYYVNVNGINN
jgi:hypothetical protein